jgi:hypothetical protein
VQSAGHQQAYGSLTADAFHRVVAVLQVPLASIPQFYFPGGAEPVDEDVKQQFVVNVNALFDPHPNGLNLEQFSAVVQEVRSTR